MRWVVGLILLLGAALPPALAPAPAAADAVGGAATTYNLLDTPAPGGRLIVPWFAFGWQGWSSTLSLQSAGAAPVNVTVTARDAAGAETASSLTVPARGLVVVNGNDLGLKAGFAGALRIEGGPLVAVADFYALGRNRMTLPALAAAPESISARVPLLFHDHHGWSSLLVVANPGTEPNEVEVLFRPVEPAALGPAPIAAAAPTAAASAAAAPAASPTAEPAAAETGASPADSPLAVPSPTAATGAASPSPSPGPEAGTAPPSPSPGAGAAATAVARPEASAVASPAAGNAAPARATLTIAPGGSALVPLDAAPPDALLAALVRSTNGRPLVAAAFNLNERGAASAAPGFGAGATTLALGLLYRDRNGYSSGVVVENAGSTPATPELRLLTSDGLPRRFVARRALEPGESYLFYLPQLEGVPAGFVGAGIVSSREGGPLVALAHHVNPDAGTAMQTPGVAGGAMLLAPVLYADYAGWSSGLQVVNLEADAATVSVALFDTFGNRLLDLEPTVVAGGRTATIYVPGVAGLPPGYLGSAVVTAAGARRIAVSATATRAATADATLALVANMPLHRLDADGINLYFAEGVPLDRVRGSVAGLATARAAVPALLGAPAPPDPPEVFLFPGQNAYRRGRAALTRTPLAQVPTFSDGVSVALDGYNAILEDVGGPYRTAGSVAQLIAHEYTHQVIDALVHGRAIPRWLNEGLANWAAVDLIADSYPVDSARQWRSWRGAVASALKRGQSVPLPEMTSGQQWLDLGNSGRDDVAYGEAVLAVDRLIQLYGVPTVARMLARIGAGASFIAAFTDVTGGSVGTFSDDMLRELDATLGRLFEAGVTAMPDRGPAGTTFSFNAIAWDAREGVAVTITRPNGTQLSFSVTTSAVGFLDWAFATTARSLPGPWQARFEGDHGDQGEIGFTVLEAPASSTTRAPTRAVRALAAFAALAGPAPAQWPPVAADRMHMEPTTASADAAPAALHPASPGTLDSAPTAAPAPSDEAAQPARRPYPNLIEAEAAGASSRLTPWLRSLARWLPWAWPFSAPPTDSA